MYDGDHIAGTSSPLLDQLTGLNIPDIIQSSSTDIYLNFISDGSETELGFVIEFSAGNYKNRNILG